MKSQILEVFDKYPNLNYFGFGLFDKGKGLSESQQKEKLEKLQDKLLTNIHEVEYVVNWLQDVDKIDSFNEHISSYRLKHLAENAAQSYVSNGSLIVGAILSDFKIKIDTPNAYFNISKKSLKLKVKEIDNLKKTSNTFRLDPILGNV